MEIIKELLNFISYLKIVKNRSVNTLDAYKRDIQEMLIWYCDISLHSTKEDIVYSGFDISILENYIDFLSIKGNSASTRARKISSIKEFFKYLYRNDKISKNISELMEQPKLDKKVVITLDIEEVIKIINKVSEHKKNCTIEVEKRNKAIIFLFLNCGLRKQELINLKISDIKMSDGSIIVNGKGAKQRIVYINETVKLILAEFINKYRDLFITSKNSEYLFVSKKTIQLCPKSINIIVENLLESTGLLNKGYTVHTLRKTCATLMYKGGEDIRTIQQVLGHSNITTTTIYVGVSEEMKQNAGRKNLW